MNPVDRATLFLFALVVAYALYQFFLRELKCRYCGRINGHEQNCPFDLNREQRR